MIGSLTVGKDLLTQVLSTLTMPARMRTPRPTLRGTRSREGFTPLHVHPETALARILHKLVFLYRTYTYMNEHIPPAFYRTARQACYPPILLCRRALNHDDVVVDYFTTMTHHYASSL